MEPNQFDRISQFFATRRLSRRRALRHTGTGLAAAGLAAAAARNFARWPILTDAQVGPFDTPTQPTWQAQVDNMRRWAKARMAWLDAQWM